ncbi:unnamed protein product [Caenorhabditis sp. 36 PRJEB53466]|nr:unnamed protein product [Caenorhabditis sp. 36 PRJEB53466]
MIVHLCLLLNAAVFLLVNCSLFDDDPPRHVVGRCRPQKEKKKKQDTLPKTTDPKMKPREANDNETVDETPSQWGDFDAEFVKSPARNHKKRTKAR